MTAEIPASTEAVPITSGLLELLLNYTRDPDTWTDKTRSLVVALHSVTFDASNRWVLALTRQHLEAIHFILQVHRLNPDNKAIVTRYTNLLCRHSYTFFYIEEEYREKYGQPVN